MKLNKQELFNHLKEYIKDNMLILNGLNIDTVDINDSILLFIGSDYLDRTLQFTISLNKKNILWLYSKINKYVIREYSYRYGDLNNDKSIHIVDKNMLNEFIIKESKDMEVYEIDNIDMKDNIILNCDYGDKWSYTYKIVNLND